MSRYHELKKLGFRFDHTATERGYVSRKVECVVKPYVGRFGIGVKVLMPRTDTTRYVYASYYILNPSELMPYPEIEVWYKKPVEMLRWTFSVESYKVGKYDYTITEKSGLQLKFPKTDFKLKLKEWDDICD